MKIICIGRNYVAHAKELNNPLPAQPIIFLKPETAIIQKRQPFFIPDFSDNIHYEVELVIKICKLGKNIQKKFAHTYYNELALGIDFTARDIQKKCIENGWPWEITKAFDGSAAIGHFVNKKQLPAVNIPFTLHKNGTLVQEGNSKNMIFDFDHLISYISQYFTLKIGDFIFTGTPAGVGKLSKNDILEAYLDGEKNLSILIK